MPYDMSDHTRWPTEEAWREAAHYRGREIKSDPFDQTGYFTIETDSDINMLKQLLAEGYIVSVGVKATPTGSMYELLDNNDVAENDVAEPTYTDHANTVVGYKEGAAWDINNPDQEM